MRSLSQMFPIIFSGWFHRSICGLNKHESNPFDNLAGTQNQSVILAEKKEINTLDCRVEHWQCSMESAPIQVEIEGLSIGTDCLIKSNMLEVLNE